MPEASNLYLVVDASVLRAAGTAACTRARNSRDVLEGILRNGHYVVVTRAIVQEWDRHSSYLGLLWRSRMMNRRRLVTIPLGTSNIRGLVLQYAPADARHVIEKDIHLIEAALNASEIIFSLDLRARGHFSRLTPYAPDLCRVVWVSPEVDFQVCEDCISGQTAELTDYTLKAVLERSAVST
ncbi:MAG: hypothetical protein CW346_18345 [Bacillaceae bacterium]|nr:hypothetical protein [Bacillaceae bacterium]